MLKPLGHKPHYAKLEAAGATEAKSSCRGSSISIITSTLHGNSMIGNYSQCSPEYKLLGTAYSARYKRSNSGGAQM